MQAGNKKEDCEKYRPKLRGSCAFLQNTHTRKSGEITVSFTVEPRKKVMVLCDLIVKDLNEFFSLSKNQNVKVQSFSGYTRKDMLDIVKPAAQCKLGTVIIHAGTNDITRDRRDVRKILK